jgi:hypothetical protein
MKELPLDLRPEFFVVLAEFEPLHPSSRDPVTGLLGIHG